MRAAQSWVLGMKTLWVRRKSLRNVSVGQAGMGDKWEVGLQSSSPLNTGTHTAGVPSPRATMVKVAPMPSPCDCIPDPSQEHRNEDALPAGPMDQSSSQSGQRQVPSPLPGCADRLMSQRQAGVSCPYLLDHEHWNQASWPPTAVLGSSPGCQTSPYTWQKRPVHDLVPPLPLPQPGQMAVISHITLPYLSALPHLGVEGWLFRGTSESRDVSPPRRPGGRGMTRRKGVKPGERKERRWRGSRVGVLPVPAWGWGARRASALRGSLQHQHHFAVLFQPHGLCFHVLKNKPHPVLSTHHASAPISGTSPHTSLLPDPEPHKDPQPFSRPIQHPPHGSAPLSTPAYPTA